MFFSCFYSTISTKYTCLNLPVHYSPPEYAGAQAGQIMLLKAEQLLRSIVISSDINDALRLLAQKKLAAAGR